MPSTTNGKQALGRTNKWVIPLLIISVAVFGSVLMTILSPGPENKATPDKAMLVSAMPVQKEDMTISVPSQGRVSPHTRTTLISEVSGIVINVSEHFVSGGFVHEGQLLLKLDDRNYRAAVMQAEANVARANKNLIQEKGQAQVAYGQYKRSKNTKRTPEALSLLLHEPQLKESEANLAFAKAELERAKGDLEKTEIRAPYDGLIKKKLIDLGQYATHGTTFAEIIAVDYAEVRLAIPQDRLAFLDLPVITVNRKSLASMTDKALPSDDTLPTENNSPTAELSSTEALLLPTPSPIPQHFVPVVLKSVYGDIEYEWPAKIVRTEGFFDEKSHTLYAVARIEDPYMLKAKKSFRIKEQAPLLMGTYVEADIEGHRLQNMVKIPRHLLRAGNHVWVIDNNNQLRNRKLDILRTGGDDVYVKSGLDEGERICLTNVGEVVPGTTVRVAMVDNQDSTATAMLYD